MTAQVVPEQPPIHKELQTAIRHSLVYGLGSVAAKAIGFLMVPFYTHYLSPADYGVLEILDLTVSLFGMFLNMGITTALLQAHGAAKTAGAKQSAASTALVAVIATGLMTVLLSIAVARPISSMLLGPNVPSRYLLLSLSAFALNYISNLPGTYVRALEKSGWFATLEVSGLILALVLNILFVAVLKLGLFGVLLSSVLTAAVQAAVLIGWMLRRVGIAFSRSLLGQLISYGMPLILSNAALFALNFSDRYFLQHFRSLSVVGLYAVGYKFGFMVNYLLVLPFSSMWQARMYIVHQRPDHPRIFGQLFMFYSVLLIFAALALAMFSPELVRLMVDREFRAAEPVIPIVAAAYVFCGIASFARTGTFVTGNTRILAIVGVATAVLNLGLNWALIPKAGMLGAAWATLASFVALAAANYWFSQRVIRLPLGIWRVLGAVALACGLGGVARWGIPARMDIAIPLKTLLMLLFPVALWKAGVFSLAEMESLAALTRGLRDRVFSGDGK
ncbi:MAG: oligosaccharide flippase family protein [Bryobacteraceae bacterium]